MLGILLSLHYRVHTICTQQSERAEQFQIMLRISSCYERFFNNIFSQGILAIMGWRAASLKALSFISSAPIADIFSTMLLIISLTTSLDTSTLSLIPSTVNFSSRVFVYNFMYTGMPTTDAAALRIFAQVCMAQSFFSSLRTEQIIWVLIASTFKSSCTVGEH